MATQQQLPKAEKDNVDVCLQGLQELQKNKRLIQEIVAEREQAQSTRECELILGSWLEIIRLYNPPLHQELVAGKPKFEKFHYLREETRGLIESNNGIVLYDLRFADKSGIILSLVQQKAGEWEMELEFCATVDEEEVVNYASYDLVGPCTTRPAGDGLYYGSDVVLRRSMRLALPNYESELLYLGSRSRLLANFNYLATCLHSDMGGTTASRLMMSSNGDRGFILAVLMLLFFKGAGLRDCLDFSIGRRQNGAGPKMGKGLESAKEEAREVYSRAWSARPLCRCCTALAYSPLGKLDSVFRFISDYLSTDHLNRLVMIYELAEKYSIESPVYLLHLSNVWERCGPMALEVFKWISEAQEAMFCVDEDEIEYFSIQQQAADRIFQLAAFTFNGSRGGASQGDLRDIFKSNGMAGEPKATGKRSFGSYSEQLAAIGKDIRAKKQRITRWDSSDEDEDDDEDEELV